MPQKRPLGAKPTLSAAFDTRAGRENHLALAQLRKRAAKITPAQPPANGSHGTFEASPFLTSPLSKELANLGLEAAMFFGFAKMPNMNFVAQPSAASEH